MISNLADILVFARMRLTTLEFERFMRDDPLDHAPAWHELGVYGHIQAVYRAAEQLSNLTHLNIRKMALNHDIGKIPMFSDAVASRDKGYDPIGVYDNHEKVSAQLAAASHLSLSERRAITIHHWAYNGASVRKIINFLEDEFTVRRWILLCAADAQGKGWTDKQIEQRPVLAQKLQDVALAVGMPADGSELQAAIAAVLSREPIQV
jgi:hypothetical protein